MRVRPYPVNMPYYGECAAHMRCIRLVISSELGWQYKGKAISGEYALLW